MNEVRIEVAVSNPDEETLRRCQQIIDELHVHRFLMSVGGEISGAAPVWRITWRAGGGKEPLLRLLIRALDHKAPGWREILTVR